MGDRGSAWGLVPFPLSTLTALSILFLDLVTTTLQPHEVNNITPWAKRQSVVKRLALSHSTEQKTLNPGWHYFKVHDLTN